MKYRLFYINDTDFSDYVDTKSYSINQEDIVETWTDANYKMHGALVKQRVTGSVTLLFTNPLEYNNFVDTYQRSKTSEGKCPIGVHVNNSETSDMITEFNAFLTCTAKVIYATPTYNRDPVVIQVSCQITEE